MHTFTLTVRPGRDGAWPLVAEEHGPELTGLARTETQFGLRPTVIATFAPDEYGVRLGEAAFAGPVGDLFRQARARVPAGGCVHVRLRVEPEELRAVRWERLCAPHADAWLPLARDQEAPLSLVVPTHSPRQAPFLRAGALRALAVAASPPPGNSYGLEGFDAAGALAAVRAALGQTPCDVLGPAPDALGLPTLDDLCAALSGRNYPLLHITCHANLRAGESVLYFLEADGTTRPVPSDELVDRLRGIGLLPRVVCLAACDTAAPGTGDGLAQALIRELGISVVVAMADEVSVDTGTDLWGPFYARLRKHGLADRALAEACAGLAGRPDVRVPVPVLFSHFAGSLFGGSDPADGLAAADRLLEGLTAGPVPAADPALPVGSHMPLHRNSLFVGREAELRAVAAALVGGGRVAVAGMRGVGKTQLASEFVYRYGRSFAGGVFWLSFADGRAVEAEIAACSGAVPADFRPVFAGLPVGQRAEEVSRAWADPVPRLLVFDNCEDPNLFAKWTPRTGGCRVLVTSWRERWPAALGVQAVPLTILGRNQSVALLRKHLGSSPAEEADLAAIAAELGDLPLALHLAGSVLAAGSEPVPPAEYLVLLRRAGPLAELLLDSDDPSPTGHVQHVASTFALSYDRLNPAEPVDALALNLVARAARLAPGEPIPSDLLRAAVGVTDGVLGALRADKALARLATLGFVERGAVNTVRLHRLVAAFVQARAADPDAQAAVERAMLAAARPGGPPLPAVLLPHLRHVAQAASSRADQPAARLCTTLGDYLMGLGDAAGARGPYAQALAMYQGREGDRAPETVAALSRLGLAHKERGEYAQAQGYFERALAADPDNVDTLTGLGFVLKDQGRYAEARRHFKHALRASQALHGEQDRRTAAPLNHLGLVCKDQRLFAQAQRYFERALGVDPDNVESLTGIGFVLKDRGQYAEAQDRFEHALRVAEAVYGPRHPDTIAALTSLAFVFLDRAVAGGSGGAGPVSRLDELFAEARAHLARALAALEEVYPERHPRIADGADGLGEVMLRQREFAGAEVCFRRALDIRDQSLGPLHTDTARSLTNLGRAFAEQFREEGDGGRQPDRLAVARDYLARAVAVYEQTPGPTPASADAARARAQLRDVEARIKSRSDFASQMMAGNLR